MKKVVRMLGLCALVALAFTSCKKDDNTNKVTFKATITQPVADDRTGINTNNEVIWTEGDEIQVFDENGNTTTPFVATLTGNPREATFFGDGAFLANIHQAGKYTAFYPVQSYDANTVTMNAIPYEQTFVRDVNRIMTDLYPMHATNNDEGNFVFSSDAGLLRISLFSSSTFTFNVKRIEIIAPESDVVNGTLVYNNVTRSKEVVPAEVANKVVLQCDNVTLPESPYSVNFDIVVLGGAFENGFTIKVVRENDMGEEEYYTRTTTENNIVNGGHIRAMPVFDVTNYAPVPVR